MFLDAGNAEIIGFGARRQHQLPPGQAVARGQLKGLAGLIDSNDAVLDPADVVVQQLVIAGGHLPALKFITEQFVQQRLKQKPIPRFDQNDGATGCRR